MKNIVNFRALFFCFIAFCFAILFSAHLIKGQAIYIAFFSLVLLGLLILALWRKKFLQIALIFLFLSLGIGSYFINLEKFNNAHIFAQPQTISAQVQAVTNHTNSQSLVLKNIKINGEKQNFKISLFVVNGNLKLADIITFEGLLENVQPFDLGKFSSFSYNNNIL